MLENPTLLVHPKFDQPFIIQCDASGSAIGFMLGQVLMVNLGQLYLEVEF